MRPDPYHRGWFCSVIGIGLIGVALAVNTGPAEADEWTGKDKTQHAVGGFALGSLTTALTKSKAAGCLMGAGVGLAKEAYDAQHPAKHSASFKDFAVTTAAGCLGAQFSGLFISPGAVIYRKEF